MQPEITIKLWALAVIIGVSIVVAFTIHFSKQKKAIIGGVYWTADNYFNHLKKQIILSDSIKELETLRAWIEGFRVKSFREGIFRRDRKRYYKLLKEAYAARERELNYKPENLQLCKS